MRNGCIAVPCALALAGLVAPAAAPAATLTPNKPCFGGGDTLVLTGTGFTANAAVAFGVTSNGVNRALADRQADAAGMFQYTSPVPFLTSTRRRTDVFMAVDRANTANGAQAGVLLSRIRVTVRPGSGSPRRVRRIRATGFTTGRSLYAHIRRGRRGRNIRIGRLRGGCKSLSARKRLFRRARSGTYRVYFDVARRYRRSVRQRVAFRVTIFRTFRPATAGAASPGERWERID